MNKIFNKIEIAEQMFSEAERRLNAATVDSDYIVSIVLAGSVLGIVEPLLRARNLKPTHDIFVEISNLVSTSSEKSLKHGAFKAVYNSLKHAGDPARKKDAWADTEFSADLFEEAGWLVEAARQDLQTLRRTIQPLDS